jgi:RHS repeat-associated protein
MDSVGGTVECHPSLGPRLSLSQPLRRRRSVLHRSGGGVHHERPERLGHRVRSVLVSSMSISTTLRRWLRSATVRSAVLMGGAAALMAAALVVPGTTFSSAPPRHLHGDLTSATGPTVALTTGELDSGGSMVEHCMTCELGAATGEGQGHGGTAADSVDPITGNLTANYSGFSLDTGGGPLAFGLNYNSDQAQTAEGGTYAGDVGYGWTPAMSSGLIPPSNASTDPTVVWQDNGSRATFVPEPAGGCITGEVTRIVTGSNRNYCAPYRQAAELGYYSTYAFYLYDQNGGLRNETYDYLGQMASEGNLNNAAVVSVTTDVAPGSSGCPTTSGVNNCTIYTDLDGHKVIFAMTGLGSFSSVTDPDGNVYNLKYNTNANLTSVTDPLGRVTSFSYDSAKASPYQSDLTGYTDARNNTTSFAYNSHGQVQSTTDAASGSQTTFSYACASSCLGTTTAQTTTVKYPDGDTEIDSYTGGLLSQKQFGSSSSGYKTWTYQYADPDSLNSVTTTDPMGHQTTNSTTKFGNPTKVTDGAGNVTSAAYNTLNEPCWSYTGTSTNTCTSPPAGATVYTYDADGNLLTKTDPLGNKATYTYDALGNVLTATDPMGHETTFTYPTNTSGAPISNEVLTQTVDPTGLNLKTSYGYDGDGDVTSTVSPLGNVSGNSPATYTTTNVYDADSELTSSTAPMSRQTTYSYDNAGNVTQVTDPAGYVSTTAYDADERACWTLKGSSASTSCSSPPTGATVTTYWKDTDAPLTVTDPNGHTTTYAYANPAYPDDPTTVNDAAGNVTTNVYNADGQVCVTGTASTALSTSTCAAMAGYSYTQFNTDGNPTSVTDPDANATTYAYGDARFPQDPTSASNAIGVSTTYTYNADGQVATSVDSAGNTVSLAYNADGGLCWRAAISSSAACSSPPTGATSYVYDAAGRTSQFTDNVGTGSAASTTYSYDQNSELLSTTDDNAKTVGYAYDAAGDATCISYPVSGATCANAPSSTNDVVDRATNADGQLTSMTDWFGLTTTFGYDPTTGALSSIAYPASTGASVTLTHDLNENLTSITDAGTPFGSGTTTNYGYNADEQMCWKSTSTGSGTCSSPPSSSQQYTYNPMSQVTSDGQYSYSADAAGRLNSVTPVGGPGTTNTYNAGEELTGSSNGTTSSTYAYNANGERCWSASGTISSPSCSSPPSGATTYGWNAYGQLCWTGSGSATGSCTTPPSGATTYTYAGNGLRISDTANGSQDFTWDPVSGGSLPELVADGSNYYLYGPNDVAPIEQIPMSGSPQFLTSDPTGVRSLFDSSGNLDETKSYSTFGTPTSSGSGSTPFGFEGGYTDPSGLVYLLNRYYDPSTAQFLSVDPDVGQTGQPYVYCGDDPVNGSDPTGQLMWGGPGGNQNDFAKGNGKAGNVTNSYAQRASHAEVNNLNRQAESDFLMALYRHQELTDLADTVIGNEWKAAAADASELSSFYDTIIGNDWKEAAAAQTVSAQKRVSYRRNPNQHVPSDESQSCWQYEDGACVVPALTPPIPRPSERTIDGACAVVGVGSLVDPPAFGVPAAPCAIWGLYRYFKP